MKVLIVQHTPNEGPGLAEAALRRAGFELCIVHPYAGEVIPEVADFAGVLLLGGPMGVRDIGEFPFLRLEMRLIEHALMRDCPILGICLGSQLLAAVLGARIEAGAAIELGFHEVRPSRAARGDALFGKLPRSFTPLHWHGDIFDLPRGAVSLGRSEKTACQAFRYGRYAYGVLFHLEAPLPQIAAMADTFPEDLAAAGITKSELLQTAMSHLPAVEQVGTALFAAFAQLL